VTTDVNAVAPPIGAEAIRFGPLQLSTGTTRTNALAYYWLALTAIMVFTFVPGIQAALLSTVLGLPEAEQGRVTGLLGLVAEIVLIVVVAVAGAASDRRGRRIIAVGGYTMMGIGIAITPFMGSVVPLLAARAVLSVGIAMVTGMLATIIADYVRNETRGVANGILGFANGIGALVTFLVLVQLPEQFESLGLGDVAALRATYLAVAGLSLLTALVLRFGLRGGPAVVTEEHAPMLRLLKVGLSAGRRPGLALSYAAAFVSRADMALVGAFLILWATQYGQSVGLSSAEALAKGGILMAVAMGTALVTAPVIGIVSDRLGRVDAVLLALGVSAVGYGSTLFVEDPFSVVGYTVAAAIGVGQTSGVIASQVLVAEQAPPNIRGSVIGTFGLFGGVGIMVALGVGGILFDAWRPAGPFVLFATFALFSFVFGLVVRGRIPREEAADADVDSL
jgi:MFS family permease